MRRAHEFLDRSIKEALEKELAKGEPPPPCRSGCSACCSEPVQATTLEARKIVKRVATMPKEDQERIVAAVVDTTERLVKSGLHKLAHPPALRYRALRLPCPLLAPDGTCSVYDIRPMSCRVHYAKANPEACADPKLRPTQQYAYFPIISLEAMFMLGSTEWDHLIFRLHYALFDEAPEGADATKFTFTET